MDNAIISGDLQRWQGNSPGPRLRMKGLDGRSVDTTRSHLLERLNHLRTQEDFGTFLPGAAEEMGFDMFAYAGGRLAADRATARTVFQRPPITMSSFPREWLTHDADQGYFKDDYVVVQSLRVILPDQWHAERGVREIRPRQAQIMREAIDAGLRRGFFVPIHGPSNDFGLLNVICHEAETGFSKIVERYKHELHICALHSHDAVQKRLPASAAIRLSTDRSGPAASAAWTKRSVVL
jgi:hypothetical protein